MQCTPPSRVVHSGSNTPYTLVYFVFIIRWLLGSLVGSLRLKWRCFAAWYIHVLCTSHAFVWLVRGAFVTASTSVKAVTRTTLPNVSQMSSTMNVNGGGGE